MIAPLSRPQLRSSAQPMPQDDTESKKDEHKALQARVRDLVSRAPVTDGEFGRAKNRTAQVPDLCRIHRALRYRARLSSRPGRSSDLYPLVRASRRRQPARPVCFRSHGGPGAASAFLNLGALGPRRVVINDDGAMPPPPYKAVDNPDTWLEHFDLVFIDPPHTGFSTTASEDVRKKMLSVDGDINAVASFIRQWLTRHNRWDSPVYLAGESYGTTRRLASRIGLLDLGIALKGIILISCAIDLQTLVFEPKNDLPLCAVPASLRVCRQYHGKLTGDLASSGTSARSAAEQFVEKDILQPCMPVQG